MEDKLKLLSLADDFTVNKMPRQNGFIEFEITMKDSYEDNEENPYYLVCFLTFNDKSKLIEENYYVSGVYNSGLDYARIDIKQLQKLQDFVELMKGD